MSGKSKWTSVLACVFGVSALTVPAAAPAATAPVAKLAKPGASAFWQGRARPEYDAQLNNFQTVYATVYNWKAYARDFPLKVGSGGHRLRVAVDWSSYSDYVELALVDPSGEEVEFAWGYNSAEAFVERPRAGTWIARTYAYEPGFDAFRVRAKLEGAPAPRPRSAQRLLPNLRLVPPFEFTFNSPYDGYCEGCYGRVPRVTPPESHTYNCSAGDIAEQSAVRCLRFSLGPMNMGPGPFQMRFDGPGLEGKVFQRIHDTDGAVVERGAGTFEYHKTHQHYHHTGFGTLELYRVTDAARGRMVPAGTGPKQGFCTADIVMVNFERFWQAPKDSTESTCLDDYTAAGYVPSGTLMGISPGWADLYGWSMDGNYIEFGDNGDGLYVVRAIADEAGHVLETDETDNTSYAYLKIEGTKIRVLERGFGTSPWDPRKQLARDILNPTPPGYE